MQSRSESPSLRVSMVMQLLAIVGALATLAYVLAVVFAPDEGPRQLWDGWVLSAASATAAGVVICRASAAPQRRVWLSLAVGIALAAAVADILFTFVGAEPWLQIEARTVASGR